MPMHVTERQVREALRPYLGSALVDQTDLCAGAASLMRTYAPYRDTFEGMTERVEQCLFTRLYDLLGADMTLRLDDGRVKRVRMRELPELADEAMGALFDAMQVYSVNYAALKDYSMRAASLSALRVLYQRYGAFQSPEEKALLSRIIRERFPASRYEGWLREEAEDRQSSWKGNPD